MVSKNLHIEENITNMCINHADNGTMKDIAVVARKYLTASQNDIKPLRTPVADGLRPTSIPTVSEAMRPVCPNPQEGFQPLSQYLVDRITEAVIHRMEKLCKERGIGLDLKYWKQQTRFILAPKSTTSILVIASPAGSGKSTWIEAFAATLIDFFQTDKALEAALVGITIVLQKVEDLNRLAEVLNFDTSKDIPNMVALQGWSHSGQQYGFCQNASVDSFDGCRPKDCPFAQGCKLLAFHRVAERAPIIGLTQERFAMLRDSTGLGSVLYRSGEDGCSRPRRHLIFDEKIMMAQISTLDKNCIDQASIEFSGLIKKIAATDSQVRSLQQRLSYHVERPFQDLRRSLCCETERGKQDIQAGFCAIPSEYTEEEEQFAFQDFCNLVLCQKKQYGTKHLRMALTVMTALYSGERCLFSKTNGFAITHIVPPPLQYGESQSIIFDATAKVDEDYRNLQNAKFSNGVPMRKRCHLSLHIYTHSGLNVSKKSMKSSWKLPALSQLTAELMEKTKGEIFVCCYKDYAEALADALKKILPPESYSRILLMPDREHDTIPYFGGTNGSNRFNTATVVFMLGYPRLSPRDYLIYASAAYGGGQVADELSAIGEENLLSKTPDLLWTIPSVKSYMAHHLAARLEQEVYRCALRNPDCINEISVYLFCPPADMLEILCTRLDPTQVFYHDELPACVEMCKRLARSYEGAPTQYGRLVQFLASWDGSKQPVQEIRAELNISRAVWKDLMGDERVKQLLEQYQIRREGRGPNAVWFKPCQEQCA